MPCALGRYHYNVANSRVEQHVEKGNDDGLFISSVACCQELWALIMDAGTGFSAQARARTPPIAFSTLGSFEPLSCVCKPSCRRFLQYMSVYMHFQCSCEQ